MRWTIRLVILAALLIVIGYAGYRWVYAPNTHCAAPNPLPSRAPVIRYRAALDIPPCVAHSHGELDFLDETPITHWFVAADGRTWHLVTAGDPDRQAVVLVHGFPETWYAWRRQITALAADFYVIAVDRPGHGQSDKSLNADYAPAAEAAGLAALLDTLGVWNFNLVTHDRGSVVGDNMLALPRMEERVVRYARLQHPTLAAFNEPWPIQRLMSTPLGTPLLRSQFMPDIMYNSAYAAFDIDDETRRRLALEANFFGAAEAIPLGLQGVDPTVELATRRDRLMGHMSMPVLLLEGRFGPGADERGLAAVAELLPVGRAAAVDAGHWPHQEAPDAVNALLLTFLKE